MTKRKKIAYSAFVEACRAYERAHKHGVLLVNQVLDQLGLPYEAYGYEAREDKRRARVPPKDWWKPIAAAQGHLKLYDPVYHKGPVVLTDKAGQQWILAESMLLHEENGQCALVVVVPIEVFDLDA